MQSVQNNMKINHYLVILFQHNKFEIYLETYPRIFRKNFLHIYWIFKVLILKTFLWIITTNSLFENAAERYWSRRIPNSCVGNNIGKIDKKLVPSIYTFVQIRSTSIKAWVNLNFAKIPSPIMELAALEPLRNWWIMLWPLLGALIFYWIFFIVAGNKDNHKSLDEF